MKSILLSVCLFMCGTAPAVEYFISPTGDDTQAGDISAPWQTLSHSIAQLQEGDTLTFRAGTYRLIDEPGLNTINTPHLTLQGFAGETADILGSWSTAEMTWEAWSADIWRIPADAMTNDPTGMFQGSQRISHQSDLDGGRDHDHVSNLTSPNHWTKADDSGTQCFADNTGCYIYLFPASGENPNEHQYELAQRSFARVAANGHHMVIRNLNFYYTQSNPVFFEAADFITLENNTFAHVSNGNDNAYAVRIWDSQGSVVRGNHVYDSVYWGGISNSKGITFMVNKPGAPNVVEYNIIHDIPGRSAVGTKGGTANMIVRYNLIYDVYNAFEPGSFRCVWSATNTDGCQTTDTEYRPAGDWQIYGNIVTNSSVGLSLPAFDEDNHNNLLYNNVFYQVDTAIELGWDGSYGLQVINNIFMNNEIGLYLESGGTTTTVPDYLDQFDSHHNLYYGNSHADIHLRPNWNGNHYSGTPYTLNQFQTLFSGEESQSITTDPLFINTIDFYLTPDSPAAGTGDGSLWALPAVNMGAHPLNTLDDVIFTNGYEPI
jgi:hypothetical protein